jgi:predicted RNase H-like HicB family nuclease
MIIRCYAEKDGNLWVAVCIDFGLAAQGESYELAREKLHGQIGEYVYDALVGEDKAHAGALLSRRAPLSQVVRFYFMWRLSQLNLLGQHVLKKFKEVMPVVPADDHYRLRQTC